MLWPRCGFWAPLLLGLRALLRILELAEAIRQAQSVCERGQPKQLERHEFALMLDRWPTSEHEFHLGSSWKHLVGHHWLMYPNLVSAGVLAHLDSNRQRANASCTQRCSSSWREAAGSRGENVESHDGFVILIVGVVRADLCKAQLGRN